MRSSCFHHCYNFRCCDCAGKGECVRDVRNERGTEKSNDNVSVQKKGRKLQLNMHWKTTQICLGLTIFFIIAIQTGFSIMCWECNSEYDRRCADPFRNYTFSMTDCDQRFLGHYPNVTASVCRKITQKIKGEVRYIRSCGFLESGDRPCIRKAGTFDVQIEFCHCNGTDGCNTATSLSGPGLGTFVFSSTILIAIARLLLPVSQV